MASIWDKFTKKSNNKGTSLQEQYSKQAAAKYKQMIPGATPIMGPAPQAAAKYKQVIPGVTPIMGPAPQAAQSYKAQQPSTGAWQGPTIDPALLAARRGFQFDPTFGMNVMGLNTERGGGTGGAGGGGGAGVAAAYLTQLKAQTDELAGKERSNIEARRDAAIKEIEQAYADQMAYLDTQTQGLQSSAATGREKVGQQQQATIGTAMQQAELGAQQQRDVYKDLILQGRRRARATGAGSSSGYQEITGMLDNQLARNLGQVEQTKQNQVAAANMVADQAVSQIENSLQSALGEITNNRAISLREKDKQTNEARMNAADALLEVDKWVSQAMLGGSAAMATGGGGGRSGGSRGSYSRTNYTGSQNAMQQQILGSLQGQLNQLEALGMATPERIAAAWQAAYPALTGAGMSGSEIKGYQGLLGYAPQQPPGSAWELWYQGQQNPNLEDWFRLQNTI